MRERNEFTHTASVCSGVVSVSRSFVHAGVVLVSEESLNPRLIPKSALNDYPELPISYSCSVSIKKPNETTLQRICEVLSSADECGMSVLDDGDGDDEEGSTRVRVGSSSVQFTMERTRTKSSSSRLLLSSRVVKCSWSFEDAALAERCLSLLQTAHV